MQTSGQLSNLRGKLSFFFYSYRAQERVQRKNGIRTAGKLYEGTSGGGTGNIAVTDSASNTIEAGQKLVVSSVNPLLLQKWGLPVPVTHTGSSTSIILGIFSIFTLIGRLITVTTSVSQGVRVALRKFHQRDTQDTNILNYKPSVQELAYVRMSYMERQMLLEEPIWKFCLTPAIEEALKTKVLEWTGDFPNKELDFTRSYRVRASIPERVRPVGRPFGVHFEEQEASNHDQLAAKLSELDESDLSDLVTLLGQHLAAKRESFAIVPKQGLRMPTLRG
jgi:hypothetical protein